MKYTIFTGIVLMSFLLLVSGCNYGEHSDNNDDSVDTEPSVSSTETSVINMTEETSEIIETTVNYIDNPLKKLVSYVDTSRPFYGYADREPLISTGTGPEKPEDFTPPDHFFFCKNPEINDHELKKMVTGFIEKSEKDILADYEKYCRFNCIDEVTSESCMKFIENICIINDYCFVSVDYTENGLTYKPSFESRTGYFKISERKQLEVTDLFYQGTDFAGEINSQIRRSSDDDIIISGSFKGISKDMMLISPNASGYNGHYELFGFRLASPVINPYGSYSVSLSDYYLAGNCAVFAEPVFQPESIVSDNQCIYYEDSSHLIKYGQNTKRPVFIIFPLESSLFTSGELDELSERLHKYFSEKLESYPFVPDSETGYCRIEFALTVKYISEIDAFKVKYESDGAYIGEYLFDRLSLELISWKDMFSRALGEDWISQCDINCPEGTELPENWLELSGSNTRYTYIYDYSTKTYHKGFSTELNLPVTYPEQEPPVITISTSEIFIFDKYGSKILIDPKDLYTDN